MQHKKFKQLVKGRENDRVDFKIRFDAFHSKLNQPKPGLAKDICAIANNGAVATYIMLGMRDDGKDFLSVSNAKLTTANVQSLCKTAFSPPPRTRLLGEHWPTMACARSRLASHQAVSTCPQALSQYLETHGSSAHSAVGRLLKRWH